MNLKQRQKLSRYFLGLAAGLVQNNHDLGVVEVERAYDKDWVLGRDCAVDFLAQANELTFNMCDYIDAHIGLMLLEKS